MQELIGECINSIIAQTYKDFEIILVNDCSTDNTLTVLQSFKELYPEHITVLDSKSNLRQGGARNLGIKYSKSEYIGFVDADDYIHPLMFESLMNTAKPCDLDVVYCMHKSFRESSEINLFKSKQSKL